MKFDIILRTCSRVPVFSGQKPRIFNVSKSELIARSLNSLVKSINHVYKSFDHQLNRHQISLTVIDDYSEESCIRQIYYLLNQCHSQTQVIRLTDPGNYYSLKTAYEFAQNNCSELIYFVEDDYLHDLTAIQEILDTYLILQSTINLPINLFPCDYPDRYKQTYPTQIVLGSHRHWYSVKQTTGTFVTTHDILCKYLENHMKFAKYRYEKGITEENTINLIYREIPCFAPLPSLAIHWQYHEHLSPYIDWQKWWKSSAI